MATWLNVCSRRRRKVAPFPREFRRETENTEPRILGSLELWNPIKNTDSEFLGLVKFNCSAKSRDDSNDS